MRQSVIDRDNHSIYLTDERWQHILEGRPEMEEYRDRLLEVLTQGQRRQTPLDSSIYKYSRKYNDLEPGFNTIVAVVKFGWDQQGQPNNFVLTAYQVYDY